ncbi:T9SS type A sorting domain-containing protein [Chitinophaga agrisoli]|uniref:T9SS type A sorting domain-containing protein n=1 Tax=Chitinophaga agrisoli TaxID=2607653 RepID=A0A5B2VUY5_9BACT|nr:T9SS type A sorting domain-containing protein [Chitinophaga agrisoli]KAA2242438.1 T9SS type A sorting domain-containing protein [Chitinophaga agrisoli]
MRKHYPFLSISWLAIIVCSLLTQQSHAQQTYANSQSNGTSGLCFLCSVSNAGNSVNTNLTDYAQFNISGSLGTVTIYQNLVFPAAATRDCDSLVIGIGVSNNPGTNPYGPVTVQTYLGNTSNNDAQPVSDAILRPLQGYGKAEIVLKPQQRFDRVRVTLNSGGGLTSLRVYYAYRKGGVAMPDITTPQSPVCGSTALQVNNYTPGLQYHVRMLYSNANGVLLDTSYQVTSGDSLPVPANRTTDSVQVIAHVQAIDPTGGCGSDSTEISFTLGAPSQPALVDISQPNACAGSPVTLHAYTASASAANMVWYDTPSGGQPLYTGDYLTVNPEVTTTYYVSAQTQCESLLRTAAQVLVSPRPPAPTLLVADTITMVRFTNLTLSAAAPDSGIIQWYRSDTATTPQATGNSYTFTALTAGTLYFYAGVEANGCISLRKQIVVIVTPVAAPVAKSSPVTAPAAHTLQQAPVQMALSIYPNPAHGTIRFNGAKDFSGSRVRVIDGNGREVQAAVLQKNGFELKPGLKGMYIIQVMDKERQYTGKVLVQ